jgi:predicted Zn finger-like uncharacterized protein
MATVDTPKYIGTTACDECGTRFRVSSKYKDRIGKPSRCPKCKSIFTVELIESTPLEKAAIDTGNEAEESAGEARKKRRRSKDKIRQDTIDKISDGFKQLHPRLVQISESTNKEEEVRHWCIDVLKVALGYSDDDIEIQVPTLSVNMQILSSRKMARLFWLLSVKALSPGLAETLDFRLPTMLQVCPQSGS